MPSAKYLGYLSGAAVAAGVGAAIAVAGPGTAHAETDGGSAASESSESKATSESTESKAAGKADKRDRAPKPEKTDTAQKDTVADTVDAGPRRPPTNLKPKFDPADAVKELTKHFGVAKPEKSDADAADDESDTTDESPAVPEPAGVPERVSEPAPTKVFDPLGDLATKASEAAAVLAKPLTTVRDGATDDGVDVAAGPVPWSLNPFRPMPPEPAPNDMPGLIWNIEQTVINAFEPISFLQPFVREGYEGAFRASQMIPFVNAVIPIVNIADQLPNLATGDPVVFRNATQSIINNLIVTLHPVSVLYYGYDEIADLINLEYEAQQLKDAFYATAWNLLDPFALLHNRGESGLPLSPSTPSSTPSPTAPQNIQVVKLAAAAEITATADSPGSNPFREDDPDPLGIPAAMLEARNFVMAFLPAELKPVYREGFELVYRGSQMVPFVNTVVPITEILPALIQAISGDKAGAQRAINALLLTTGPVSVLYYGFDQIADLLNVENAAFAAKEELYITVWNNVDPQGILHHVGESGLTYV
jgi:hypothetical protein